MKTAIIVAMLFAFSIHADCYGLELNQQIKTPDGFTIRFPDNWRAIPKSVLDAYSQAVAEMRPEAEKQTYHYGFQLSSAREWLVYPYILIQVKKTGRVSEDKLKSIKKLQQGIDEGLAEARGSKAGIVSTARLGETIYDPAAHILFTQMGMDVNDIGSVKVLTALLLTQEGTIQINGVAKATEFENYAPVFEAIARGVVIENRLKYQVGRKKAPNK